jgi:hypothetical protein
MKSLLISLLLVGLLLVLYLRPWGRGQPPVPAPPTDRFMKQCTAVFSERRKPEEHCRCLWSKGVRNPADTLLKPAAKAPAEACGR